MMKKSFLIFLALCYSFTVFAHDIQSIVVDKNGAPLEFANVILLHAADSAFVAGGVTDANGHFCLQSDDEKNLIKVSLVGYATKYLSLPLPD